MRALPDDGEQDPEDHGRADGQAPAEPELFHHSNRTPSLERVDCCLSPRPAGPYIAPFSPRLLASLYGTSVYETCGMTGRAAKKQM